MKITTLILPEITEEQKENCKTWIKALRSGKYRQVTGCLMTYDFVGACCLGVACDIAELPKSRVLDGARFYEGEGDEKSSYVSMPPEQFFFNRYGFYPVKEVAVRTKNDQHPITRPLSALNDSDCLTFDQIADVIQAVFIDRKEITIEKNYY